jgi:two-component sensor histidine kinase
MQHFSSALVLPFLLLTLLPAGAKAQPLTAAQADSLRGLLSAGKPDTNRVQALLTLSDYYQRRTLHAAQNRDSALVLAKQAGELSAQLGYPKGQEEALFLEGKILIKGGKAGAVRRRLASMSPVTHIRLLLEMGKQQLRPANSQPAHYDSARFFFREAEKRSQHTRHGQWQEESQLLIGVTYLAANDWTHGKAYFYRVIEARRRAGDQMGEVRARLRAYATTLFCAGEECREQRSNLHKALDLCRRMGNKPWEVVTLIAIGSTYTRDADPGGEGARRARDFARRALAIQKTIPYAALNQVYLALGEESVYLPGGQYKDITTAYALLYELSVNANDYNKVLYYILLTIKDEETHGFKEALDFLYFVLGKTYFELEQFEKSVRYFRQSLAVSREKGEVVVHVALLRRMVLAMLQLGQARPALTVLEDIMRRNPPFTPLDRLSVAISFGACYKALHQHQRAEQYYLEAVSWSDQTGYPENQVFARHHLSMFYVATAQYKKVAPYLKSLQDNPATGSQPLGDRLEFALMQFKVDSALGNYPSAIRHYQRYAALRDTLFNETQSKQIERLSIEYETGKKEQALRLQEKDLALFREQSKVQQSQRNALIGGTVLLLSLLGLGYNRYRVKQRSNRQLQAQHQALRAQQDVLQAQQAEINQKNEHLSQLLGEKDSLLGQKDTLIGEKEGLLSEKDSLLQEQQRLLAEKERLLKEIHHRVKNNLQVVMSLLNSQADSLVDKAALSAIQESQHRVQAMALIHQKLYQAEGVARIPMQDYVQEVVAYLHESYCLHQQVRFCVAVEPVELDVTQAVPLGLIINEAITNAFKYAFPGGRPGTVRLSLHRLGESAYRLTIADDGVGLPQHYDPSQSRSLGMTLLHGFSAQLGGDLTLTSPPGLTIDLVFREEQLTPGYALAAHAQ